MTFEQSLARLEQIVDDLDGDGLALDDALRLFEEAVEQLRAAKAMLATAEAQVKLLVEQADGALSLEPFGG